MKTFKQFQKHYGAQAHPIIHPITKKPIRVPKGHSVPVSRSSSKGDGSDGSGDGE